MSVGHYLRKSVSVIFEYDTPRYVNINSKTVGVFSRFIQLIILTYIIGFVLVYKKGYQDVCPVESTVVTKIKGVTFTNYTLEELDLPIHADLYNRIWDPSDYVVPSDGLEHGGFFMMTNLVITPNQTRGVCPEDTKIDQAICENDRDCELGRSLEVSNGVETGRCMPSSRLGSSVRTCEINAWCPVEQDILPFNGTKALLDDAQNFTVLIKNTVAFPLFGDQYFRRNIFENANSTYLQRCRHHSLTDEFCPVFRLGDIIERSGNNFSSVAIRGGVFVIKIKWLCNLDFDFMENCRPKYSFARADAPDAKIAPGWNFRLAKYHEENRRTLSKMYGLKILIEVEGEAGKFNIVPLMLNVGSGLALMGLATIICDLIVLYCLTSRDVYKEMKYKVVQASDAFFVDAYSSSARRETSSGQYSRFDRSLIHRQGLRSPTPADETPVT